MLIGEELLDRIVDDIEGMQRVDGDFLGASEAIGEDRLQEGRFCGLNHALSEVAY
jgi:hypothetical protein